MLHIVYTQLITLVTVDAPDDGDDNNDDGDDYNDEGDDYNDDSDGNCLDFFLHFRCKVIYYPGNRVFYVT